MESAVRGRHTPAPLGSSSKFVPALALVVSLAAVGGIAGGWIAGRVSGPGTGFDGLSDVLGGMAMGAVVGCVAGGWLGRRLPVGALRRTSWIALALAASLVALLFFLRDRGSAPSDSESPPGRPTAPAGD